MECRKLELLLFCLAFIFQIAAGVARPRSCLDYHVIDQAKNGYYLVFDGKGEPYRVYCDFTSEPNFAYTLVTSWKFSNAMMIPFRYRGYNIDSPVNEFNPNWESYRISKQRMIEIRNVEGISHWRFTCNFDTMKRVDYRDYLRARFAKYDFLDHDGYGCREVEYVNAMGAGCQNCFTFFYQVSRHILSVKAPESGQNCGMKFLDMQGNEFRNLANLWGAYWIGNYNPRFRCQQHGNSTTNLWFGGKVSILKD